MKNPKKLVITTTLAIIISIIIFFIYELLTVKKAYYINEKNLQIPIFTYHDIVQTKEEIKDDCMQTTIATFEKQLTGLIKLGYKPISYQDLVQYKNGEKAISKWSFLITFDDGYKSFYEYAYPIAQKYNIPITVFVIDECVGENEYFSWEEAKEMHDSGKIAIYSHGLRHTQYNEVSGRVLVDETNKAYENLINNLGNENILKVFAYPYGLYSEDNIKEMQKEGYIQNLMDSKVNQSKNLNLSKLHRCYPLNDSIFKLILKQQYRSLKYGNQ